MLTPLQDAALEAVVAMAPLAPSNRTLELSASEWVSVAVAHRRLLSALRFEEDAHRSEISPLDLIEGLALRLERIDHLRALGSQILDLLARERINQAEAA